MSDFYVDSARKARKKHTCSLCFEKIAVGEKYVRVDYTDGGSFYHNSFHETCMDLVKRRVRETGETEWAPWDIVDMVAEDVCYHCGEGNKQANTYGKCNRNCFRCDIVLNHYQNEKEKNR